MAATGHATPAVFARYVHLTEGDVRAFVDENRAEFQPPADAEVWFVRHSNVNDWAVVWRTRRRLHYLGYSQG